MSGITHAKVATFPDDPTAEINKGEWNADHAVPAAGFALGDGGPTLSAGSDDPEGNVTAPAGSVYLRTTGVFYVKASGSGDTGWVEGVTFS